MKKKKDTSENFGSDQIQELINSGYKGVNSVVDIIYYVVFQPEVNDPVGYFKDRIIPLYFTQEDIIIPMQIYTNHIYFDGRKIIFDEASCIVNTPVKQAEIVTYLGRNTCQQKYKSFVNYKKTKLYVFSRANYIHFYTKADTNLIDSKDSYQAFEFNHRATSTQGRDGIIVSENYEIKIVSMNELFNETGIDLGSSMPQ
jgi:hypothetical protein